MPTLSNPHVIAGNFNAALYAFIRDLEAFVPRIYSDPNAIPTLGVGFALAIKPSGSTSYVLRSDLDDKLLAAGVTLTSVDRALLNDAVNALNKVPGAMNPIPPWNNDPNNSPFEFNSSSGTPGIISETQFQPLFTDQFTK